MPTGTQGSEAHHRPTVLFMCTGNSFRSQMAEAILRHLAGDRFEALSAGSHPAGFIHPLAVEALAGMGIPIGEQRSKSWDEFASRPIDAAITLCDHAAGQPCPDFPGAPLRAHWPLPDPGSAPGTDEDRLALAHQVARRLRRKIEGLIALDWSGDRGLLAERLRFLGEI
ncbi:MAG: arsenate reductase ArsC [Planctomycetota bacterium]|nr:MAG: arsenate reductase ArsC [Planctomycetota bacterium]